LSTSTRATAASDRIAHVRHDDDAAGAVERPPAIEFAQQALSDVELLGEQLHRAGVVETFERAHLLEPLGNARRERPLHVLVADFVIDEGGDVIVAGESRPGVGVELAARGEALCPLERGDGLGEIILGPGVDRAGREARAVEQHLCLEHDGARPSRGDRLLKPRGVDGLGGELLLTRFVLMPARRGGQCATDPNDGGNRDRPRTATRGEESKATLGQLRAHPMV
jgi:hypothetical protein